MPKTSSTPSQIEGDQFGSTSVRARVRACVSACVRGGNERKGKYKNEKQELEIKNGEI